MSYTAEELAAMRRRGEDRTDWAKVDATTPEEVERQAAEDGYIRPEGWEKTVIRGLPPPKRAAMILRQSMARSRLRAGRLDTRRDY